MKRFIFVLPPIILFGIFIFFYQGFLTRMDLHKKELAEQKAKSDADEAARKEIAKAAADKEAARQKAAHQAEVDKAKEAIRNAKEEAERKILNETESAIAEGKRLQAQIIKLQSDIQSTRAARDKAQAEAIETKLDLAKALIEKRNSEFEIQRYTDMLATRMAQSQAMIADLNAGAKKK
jgi:preprotein translocase subunit SecF